MTQAQFPVMRLQEFYGALADLSARGELGVKSAYDAAVRVLDQNTERIGQMCDLDGCRMLLESVPSGITPIPSQRCPEHGYRNPAATRLVTAWNPIERPGTRANVDATAPTPSDLRTKVGEYLEALDEYEHERRHRHPNQTAIANARDELDEREEALRAAVQ